MLAVLLNLSLPLPGSPIEVEESKSYSRLIPPTEPVAPIGPVMLLPVAPLGPVAPSVPVVPVGPTGPTGAAGDVVTTKPSPSEKEPLLATNARGNFLY